MLDARVDLVEEQRVATHSYFLREFIDEIVRTGAAPTRAEVAEELKNVALEAARAVFGAGTEIAVVVTEELGELRFAQVLEVVETVTEPRRQVALATLQAAELAEGACVGRSVQVPIFYTHDPRDAATIAKLRTRLGAALPLSVHSLALWEALTDRMNRALLRYFPAPEFPEGSLARLLADGGGWTRGCSAVCGEYELSLVGSRWVFYRTRVTGGWVEYGFETVVRKGGVEVFRGASASASAQLTEAEGVVYLQALCGGDNEGAVRSWGGLATSEAARSKFMAELQAVVERLAATRQLGSSEVHGLLVAAIRPPIAGGLWEWLQAALPRLLLGTEYAAEGAEFAIREVFPPVAGLRGFGSAAVRVSAVLADMPDLDAGPLTLGYVEGDALTLPGPDPTQERDLEEIVATFRGWLAVHLRSHVASHGPPRAGDFEYLAGFAGYFPLVQLLEQRLRWGPAGAVPVPPFDEAALVRAGGLLRPAAARGDRVLAAFTAAGWTIELRDDVNGRPFGSYCGISIVPPEGGEDVRVMMVDAWNPETRTVVDGDAFAFRRFATWLREAIVRGGCDAARRFVDADEEDSDDEDEDGEDGADEAAAGTVVMLSEWLLFGLPELGDRFLVDWRAQWHVVNASVGIEGFAGIYGFTGAYVERLRTRDVVCWRRFLREVIDPRFVGTVGEQLLRPT